MYFYCEKCKKQYPLNTHAIRCSCGGLFRLHKDPEDVVPQDVSIGHMVTPLVPMNAGGIEVLLKLENLQPTGSYKDRGAATLVSVAKSLGITKIALDSAGYAGASVAAYAAAAGMDCRVYVPEGVPDGARQQLQTYGAEVMVVKGTRMDACAEVKKHLGTSWYYASPAYNPLFAEGVKSLAYELYEQLGGKVPEYVFVPAGNGRTCHAVVDTILKTHRSNAYKTIVSDNVVAEYVEILLNHRAQILAELLCVLHKLRVDVSLKTSDAVVVLNKASTCCLLHNVEHVLTVTHAVQEGCEGAQVLCNSFFWKPFTIVVQGSCCC